MIDLLLSPIAPHICCGCAKSGAILCDSCRHDITSDDFGRCIWCLKIGHLSHQCTSCQNKIGTQAAWAVSERSGVLKQALNDYKFESRREGAWDLARLLDATLPRLSESTVVSWVPTAPAHIRTRGFDHAALLAKHFARLRGLRAMPLLIRKQHSLSQHELSRTARLKAANEAFGVDTGTPLPDSVLIIDDILTTGATLEACVKLLKQAGVNEVCVAVVARQPLDE